MHVVVNIDVDDLEKGIAFYSTALGLRLSRLLFEGTVAEMSGATSVIQLMLKATGSAATPSAAKRDYKRHWSPVHLDFAVTDISSAVQRAVGAGALLESEIQSFAWGRLATLSDPFGHGFCLVELSAEGYDAAP